MTLARKTGRGRYRQFPGTHGPASLASQGTLGSVSDSCLKDEVRISTDAYPHAHMCTRVHVNIYNNLKEINMQTKLPEMVMVIPLITQSQINQKPGKELPF